VLIETERLQLRPLTSGDVDDLVAIHAEAEVERFMGPVDRRRMTEWLARVQEDYAEHRPGRLAIIERVSGRFLGRSGLKYWPQFAETEVGWVLHPHAWGRGYATEAGRACARWGFQNLDVPQLTAMIRPDNQRSISVAQRIGMSSLRPDVLLGEPVTVYSISRAQWARIAERSGPS
jgi:RimJ/RimL family protein N-acetyltransferase